MKKLHSIQRVFTGYISGIVVAALIGISVSWIWYQYRQHFQTRYDAYTDYVRNQDRYLTDKMDNVFEFIRLLRYSQTESVRNELKERVEAVLPEIEKRIKRSSGSLTDAGIADIAGVGSWPSGLPGQRGHLFVVRADNGAVQALEPSGEKELDLLQNQVLRSPVFFEKAKNTTARDGEGFVVEGLVNNDTLSTHGILTTIFAKRLPGSNLIVGCISFDFNIEKVIEARLAANFSSVLNSDNLFGLIFSTNGQLVFNTIPELGVSGRIWNFVDGHGLPIFGMLLDSARLQKGGFLNYHFTGNLDGKTHQMRFHTRQVKEWGSVVTIAVSSDSVAEKIDEAVAASYNRMKEQLMHLSVFVLIILVAVFTGSRLFSGRMRRGVDTFAERMITALRDKEMVNTKDFNILELQQLANALNTVLKQREKTMAELAESEQRYRMIASSVSDVLFTLTRNFHFSYVSPSVSQLLGYSSTEAQRKSPESFIDVQQHRRMQILVMNMIRRRIRFREADRGGTVEMDLRHAKGIKVPVEIFVNPVTDVDGSFLYLLGVARNIGERRKAQRDLLESEERYRLISSNVRDVIWSCTKYFEFTYISPAVFQLSGFSPKELIGASLQLLVTPESFLTIMNKFEGVVRDIQKHSRHTSGNIVVELEHQRHDGSRFFAEINASVVTDSQGNVLSYNGITRDATERRKADDILRQSEAKLREINAAKDKFFSIIAHDLRNPFGSLLGFTSVLSDRFDDFSDSEKLTLINQLRFSSESAYRLIENLLEWSRTQTNAIEVTATLFDFSQLVDETIRLHETQAERKKIELVNTLPRRFDVYADRNMIGTVIRNLISNAIKFSLERGIVTVLHETTGEMVTIIVKDDGIGIPAQSVSKLFRIDEKIKTPGTFNEPGSGLGLVLCREFIIRNGGMIWVESTSGRGSSFYFTLPRR